MENYADETVSYKAFKDYYKSNKKLNSISFRQVIDGYCDIHDWAKTDGSHGMASKNSGKNNDKSTNIFASINLSMFGWRESDGIDIPERDTPESLTRQQEFWFNFISKERPHILMWMSVCSILLFFSAITICKQKK